MEGFLRVRSFRVPAPLSTRVMPYVICMRCGLSTYSAALWASTDVCPRCGTELPTGRENVVSLRDHPRFRRRRQAAAQSPLREPRAHE